MKCPNCKKEIANDSKFCEHCGVEVRKNRKTFFVVIAVVMAVLALCGYGYYKYEKMQDERLERDRLQQEYDKFQRDYGEYLNLVNEGALLLGSKRYSESISKFKEALSYEELYSGPEYASFFDNNIKDMIASAEQLSKEEKQQEKNKKQKEQEQAKTHGRSNGHDWVDLGLSVKWATCNVGATSPEEYGDHYAWGEISTKSLYTEDNSKTYGKSMSDISGNANYDAAIANWGGNWRMPTYDELDELNAKCTWTWTTHNYVNGYKVTSKKNGNSIFLPAAGCRYDGSLYYAGSFGYYWGSTPGSNAYSAYSLKFDSGSHNTDNFSGRDYGFSVRPVLE